MLVTPSLRHCSNKYTLAREGEKDEVIIIIIFQFRMKSSSVERDEFSVDRDPAFRIGVGRSFHQSGTVDENVLESDFEPDFSQFTLG